MVWVHLQENTDASDDLDSVVKVSDEKTFENRIPENVSLLEKFSD